MCLPKSRSRARFSRALVLVPTDLRFLGGGVTVEAAPYVWRSILNLDDYTMVHASMEWLSIRWLQDGEKYIGQRYIYV